MSDAGAEAADVHPEPRVGAVEVHGLPPDFGPERSGVLGEGQAVGTDAREALEALWPEAEAAGCLRGDVDPAQGGLVEAQQRGDSLVRPFLPPALGGRLRHAGVCVLQVPPGLVVDHPAGRRGGDGAVDAV